MIRNLPIRLGSLFGRARRERELDAELAYHIDMQTEQLMQRGLSREAARREALRLFGPVETVKDDVRDRWLSRFVEVALQDVRYGVRNLRRNPGFALIIIVTMALGIGANTAIFSVVNAVLLRPLPYGDGDRLVELHHGQGDLTNPANEYGFSPKEIADYRLARSFEDVVEFHIMYFNLIGREEPLRLSTGVVSANYFDVLGIKPLYGRTFVASDDAPGAPAVLVLTYRSWVRSFDEDPGIVGRVFRMNDKPHTVVGILPPVPLYPVDAQGREVDIYMPSSACPFRGQQKTIEARGARMLQAFARLKPEVTPAKSAADLEIVAAQLAQTYPNDYPRTGFRAIEVPLKDEMTQNFGPTLWLLLGTAGFVLLIVCASIANLMLARMVRRERELSVRAALGATRSRVLRQLLTESLLLAVTGGVLGLLLSSYTLKLLTAFAERFTPRAHEITIDVNVLLFTLAASVVTGLVFGSIPAFARRIDVVQTLRDGHGTQSSQGVRRALIVAQISASFVLLIAAGLMLRSLMKVQNVNPGFRTDNLLSFRADMSWNKFPLNTSASRPKVAAYWAAFEERLKSIPGVIEVGGNGTFPLNENDPFPLGIVRESRPLPPGVQPPQVSYRFASPEYFKTLGQPIVAGRAFTISDSYDAARVAIVNQTAARLLWPDENPIGTRVGPPPVNGRPAPPSSFATIVGVVADVRQQLDRPPTAELYVPIRQSALNATRWVVRTLRAPDQTIADIKAAARAHDADLPVASFRTMAEVRSTALAPRRVVVALIDLFGLLALVVTAAGIAGVVAFSVNQRTQEFGIRMALGAHPARVLSLVIREGLILVAIGLGLGLAGAAVLTRLLGRMLVDAANGPLLVDVTPTDALTYAGVAAVLVLVALAACFMPARRAAAVDPMVALRAQ